MATLRETCDFGRSGQFNHRKFAQLEIYPSAELYLVFGVSIRTRNAKPTFTSQRIE